MTTPKNGRDALLVAEDCVMVLIDQQPFQFANLHSHEPALILNNVLGLAKAAKAYDVPCILTTVGRTQRPDRPRPPGRLPGLGPARWRVRGIEASSAAQRSPASDVE